MRIRLTIAAVLVAYTLSANPAHAFGRQGCFQTPAFRRPIAAILSQLDSELMQHYPAETRACLLYARGLLYQLEGDSTRAIADYTSAIRWMSTYTDAYAARADAYQDAGERALALLDYAQSDQLSGNLPDELTERCWIRALRGRPLERALADCNRSLKGQPGDFNALASRALVYLRMGNFPAAIADCDSALKQKPANPTALFVRAVAKRHSRDAQGGNADLAAAKAANANVEETFAIYGVKP